MLEKRTFPAKFMFDRGVASLFLFHLKQKDKITFCKFSTRKTLIYEHIADGEDFLSQKGKTIYALVNYTYVNAKLREINHYLKSSNSANNNSNISYNHFFQISNNTAGLANNHISNDANVYRFNAVDIVERDDRGDRKDRDDNVNTVGGIHSNDHLDRAVENLYILCVKGNIDESDERIRHYVNVVLNYINEYMEEVTSDNLKNKGAEKYNEKKNKKFLSINSYLLFLNILRVLDRKKEFKNLLKLVSQNIHFLSIDI
ncbi:conserved Plasmodium protein, unknown function, partial [Plasmodium malariae]